MNHEKSKSLKNGTGECPGKTLGSREGLDAFLESDLMQQRLAGIRNRIIVLSGKGGVGKSTVAANMAVALSLSGRRVGLLDVDIHGPSIPGMLNLENETVIAVDGVMKPVDYAGLKVMSIGFLLRGKDSPVIWRGPMKMSMIKRFLAEVDWGELDFMIIDSPPGTGDEPLTICQLAAPLTGAVVVTTPQDIAVNDVRRSVMFCRHLNLPVLGIVENMSGFVCPHCGKVTDIFKAGGGEKMAKDMDVPVLGRIPIDPAIGEGCDSGNPFVRYRDSSVTAECFNQMVLSILAFLERGEGEKDNGKQTEEVSRK